LKTPHFQTHSLWQQPQAQARSPLAGTAPDRHRPGFGRTTVPAEKLRPGPPDRGTVRTAALRLEQRQHRQAAPAVAAQPADARTRRAAYALRAADKGTNQRPR